MWIPLEAATPVPVVRSLVAGADGRHRLRRIAPLTPYAVETIADDALRAGPGGRLELSVTAALDPDTLAALRRCFARLAARGIAVRVRRERVRRTASASSRVRAAS